MRWVLIVEDDEVVAGSVAAALPHGLEELTASSVQQAVDIVRGDKPLWAAIVDVNLGDGSGFAVVAELRKTAPELPILIMTGNAAHDVVSEAQIMGAQFVTKPFGVDNIAAFVDWARRVHHLPHSRLARLIDRCADEYGLSPRERELVLLASVGTPPSELAEQMKVSINTIKTTTKRILRKCNVGSISELVQPLQREALNGPGD